MNVKKGIAGAALVAAAAAGSLVTLDADAGATVDLGISVPAKLCQEIVSEWGGECKDHFEDAVFTRGESLKAQLRAIAAEAAAAKDAKVGEIDRITVRAAPVHEEVER